MYTHMLIDARNALYRAVYAGLSDPNNSGGDYCTIFFRFVSSYIRKFKPKMVHFFWDAPKEAVWRKKIYKEYKAHRDHSHGGKYSADQVKISMDRNTTICQEVITCSGCRNFVYDNQEADDLIYAFCRFKRSDKIIIVSRDSDFQQIPFLFSNVDLYDPMAKDDKIWKTDDVDPVELKCFSGDAGDNIDGYYNIGPVRAKQLAIDAQKRDDFFKTHGDEIYRLNRILIDLSLCPYTLQNITYIDEVLRTRCSFDMKSIHEIIQRHKVRGLAGDLSNSILPFKFLGSENQN